MGSGLKEWIRAIRMRWAGDFDAAYYYRNYVDLRGGWKYFLFPHYLLLGIRERRSPSASLSLPYYLGLYPEVATGEANPLEHYMKQDRLRVSWPNYTEIRPILYNLAHHERIITESGLFDPDYYLRSHPNLRVTPEGALDHYCRIGWREKRNPHPLVPHSFLEAFVPGEWERHLNPLVYFLTILPQRDRFAGWARLCARHSGQLTLHALLINREMLDFSCLNPRVSVVMVLHNQAEWTARALHSLCRERDPQTELIVVDNGSSDQTGALLNQLQGATVIRLERNLGFGEASNLGAGKARGQTILFLNNDVQLQPGALRAAEQALESASDIGAVGGRLIHFEGTLQEAGGVLWSNYYCQAYGRGASPIQSEFEFRREVNYCSGAFLMVRADVFKRLGGFDPVFSPAYYEDLDLCVRIQKNRWRILYEPRALIQHAEFGSSKSQARAFELMNRNRQIFGERHAEWLMRCPLQGPITRRTRVPSGHAPHILMIDIELPVIARGRGLPRSQAIIRSLAEMGTHLTFFSLLNQPEEWATVYREMPEGVEVVHEWGMSRLDIFMDLYHEEFDVLIVSRPGTMDYIQHLRQLNPEWFKGIKIIYDAEAVFAERTLMEGRLKGEPEAETVFHVERQKEFLLARNADAIWTVSRADQKTYQAQGFPDVHVVGHVEPVRPGMTPFKERCGFIFLGTIRPDKSMPNSDAVLWFIQNVWPEVRRILGPIVDLTIVGDAEGVDLPGLNANLGIKCRGTVDDLQPIFDRHRVFIAPTRFSAGIPLKICTASALGLPTVASRHLAEQLEWIPDQDLLAPPTGDAKAFSEACIRLHEDEILWQRLREGALERVTKEFAQGPFQSTIRKTLIDLVGDWKTN